QDPATADAVTAALGETPGASPSDDHSEPAFPATASPRAAHGTVVERKGGGHGETPAWIGPYRVLTEIGRGGMGVVYHAVREADGFRQDVAVKVVKRGMDTDFILRRFRHERQIVASLDHPHIA